ncbi:ras and Rab interactor 1-like [Cololabis saira]|uniref:ras and Rab interactor 1-like n=1 Tax=Cololabis saira TaxID=129043 RepID=UPI002AD201F4|nr:ras and Rab interactor 1-like [Cololabis saira]XP_061595506.1 ras and Rab interactor 1-like [Cololabis saira]
MAQQEEPLYDFPEPSNPSERQLPGHERGRGSLKSISVLDRLLLTVPVWLQLSINPATALHILQREPPGTFLVRMSRTSQRKVLCVRVADDSVPSFVQQFGITEEQSTLSLETSAISFPDLPRLLSFYCVSRDVLPFPLELPAAITRAASHKQLESISHMGVEFWSSHLNFRGPREASKSRERKERKPEPVKPTPPANPPTSSTAQPGSVSHHDPNTLVQTEPESDDTSKQLDPNAALFHEFCPITTRSPRELDYGSGLGALCFINPLFLQSQNTLCRRRMFKRSLKIRVSTETSTMLSPPLAPPPPPPLMPKTKGRSKPQVGGRGAVQPRGRSVPETPAHPPSQTQQPLGEGDVEPESAASHVQPEMQDQDQEEVESGKSRARIRGEEAAAQLPAVTAHLLSDYMKPPPVMNLSYPPSLSPYQSPTVSPRAPQLLPKTYPSLSPHDSPAASPSLSPYQSPSLSPRVLASLSPYHSPSFSPDTSSPPSPLTPPSSSPLTEQACFTPDHRRSGSRAEEGDEGEDGATRDLDQKGKMV